LAHDAHVKVDRDAGRLGRRPELVVLGTDGRADARHGVQPHAAEAELEAALHLADGGVDAQRGDAREADQARWIDAHDLLGEPVVVCLHAGEVELRIVVGEEVAHHARRSEQHLGVDAVDVLLLEARCTAEVPLVRGGEGHAGPAHVLVLAAGGRVDPDRRRGDFGTELPRLAPVAVGDHARDLVVELLGHVRGPDVRRLENVRVGRDQLIVTWHAAPYEQRVVRFKCCATPSTPPSRGRQAGQPGTRPTDRRVETREAGGGQRGAPLRQLLLGPKNRATRLGELLVQLLLPYGGAACTRRWEACVSGLAIFSTALRRLPPHSSLAPFVSSRTNRLNCPAVSRGPGWQRSPAHVSPTVQTLPSQSRGSHLGRVGGAFVGGAVPSSTLKLRVAEGAPPERIAIPRAGRAVDDGGRSRTTS